jgi:hypothetical protein
MADLTIAVAQLGAPLGQLALAAAAKEVLATVSGRVNGVVEFAAYDSNGDSVPFLYSNAAAGTFNRVQGGVIRLPVVDGQSWYFKQDQSVAPELQANCVG